MLEGTGACTFEEAVYKPHRPAISSARAWTSSPLVTSHRAGWDLARQRRGATLTTAALQLSTLARSAQMVSSAAALTLQLCLRFPRRRRWRPSAHGAAKRLRNMVVAPCLHGAQVVEVGVEVEVEAAPTAFPWASPAPRGVGTFLLALDRLGECTLAHNRIRLLRLAFLLGLEVAGAVVCCSLQM